jgi:hypothetical protein
MEDPYEDLTDHERELAEQGWLWITNDYCHFPQINRTDLSQHMGNWDDDQALAYVLRELAVKDPALFAVYLKQSLLTTMVEFATRMRDDPERTDRLVAKVQGHLGELEAKLLVGYPDVKLPAIPPEWLSS